MVALAEAARCSPVFVDACEDGRATPSPEVLAVWAEVLGCTAGDLCSMTPEDRFEYWAAATAAMPPMTEEEIAAVGVILRRIEDRR